MSSSCFHSYLDDLNSSVACCRSASLLLPTTAKYHGANDVLCKLREWKWICESVLIRPWVATRPLGAKNRSSYVTDCLPTEDELLFLERKYALSTTTLTSPSASLSPSPSSNSLSLRERVMQTHIESKSVIVPLTDDGTAFILRVLFDVPMRQHSAGQGYSNYSPPENIPLSVEDNAEKITVIENWIRSNGILMVHNCDGNQVVSLSKELDSFPKPRSKTSSEPTTSTDGDEFEANIKQFTFVDLFAGIGGFRIGLEALGGICVGSCEIDAYARDTYRRNFHNPGVQSEDIHEFYVNDIARLEIPPDFADVICGGFPCQSFSTMANFPSGKMEPTQTGNKKCNADDSKDNKINAKSFRGRQGGLDTPNRGKLFFHLPRILRKSRPKLFIFENVKGLLNVDSGGHFQKIMQLLEESGYQVTHGIIDTSWFLPQRRERIYFIGIRLDLLRSIGSECQMNHMQLNNLELEWKKKFQIYGNEIMNDDSMDKFDRLLILRGCHPRPVRNTHPLLPSCLGDILETSEAVSSHHPHCFLKPLQWLKISKQSYLQFHSDGTGKLLTEDDTCCQTLVSSYRQSYLMHSQFVVPRDSIYLVAVKERMLAEAMRCKGRSEQNEPTLMGDVGDKTIPRFFTPREW